MMSAYRCWRIAQRVWTGLLRDRRAIPALVLVPAMTLLLIGHAMRHSDESLTIALVVTAPEWSGRDAASFVETALHDEDVTTKRAVNVPTAERMLRDGDADAYVVIDDAFVTGVLGQDAPGVRVGLRGDDPATNRAAQDALEHALSEAPLRFVEAATGGEAADESALQIDTSYVYGGDDYDGLDYLFPAIIAFTSFLSIFTIAIVAFTQERSTRTLERMLATAVSRTEILAGYGIGYAAEAAVQTVLILGIAVLVFDAPNAGSLALVVLLTQVTAVAALTMGIALSALARNEQQAMQMMALIMVPQLVMSGVLFPLAALPQGLRVAAHAFPLTYAVDALRDVMIRGLGPTDPSVALNAFVLAAFAAVFVSLGARSLREATG
jgi:ABC-2 type transport system permease protein